jgi:SAM-dependent methyltransferase
VTGKISSLAALRSSYDRLWERVVLRERDEYYDWVLDLLQPSPGQELLDVACGAGFLVKAALDRGQSATGVDISPVALRRAQLLAPQGRYVEGPAEELPFADNSFDLVTCLGSLEHFLDPEAALREMRRVLKHDGKCCIVLPNSWYVGDVVAGWARGSGLDHSQGLERFFALAEARRLIESAGKLFVEQELGYTPPLDAQTEELYRRVLSAAGVATQEGQSIPTAAAYVCVFITRPFVVNAPQALDLTAPETERWLLSGWWADERGISFRWTEQMFRFLIARGGSLELEVLVGHPDVDRRHVQLSLKTQASTLPPILFHHSGWHSVSVPVSELPALGHLEITGHLSHTWCPAECGISTDRRPLGIGIARVRCN